MEENNLWERFCHNYTRYPSVGFALDISRVAFEDWHWSELLPRVQRALKDMAALERGDIANPDEKRMVGHYWLRAPQLSPTPEIREAIETCRLKIKEFSEAVHTGKLLGASGKPFTRVLLIGIGGSALGPQLVADALGTKYDRMTISFLDNTDPDGIRRTLDSIGNELAQTLVLVISKSGGTVETRNGQLEVAAAFQALNLDFTKNFVAITCEGSKLDRLAKDECWLAQFPLWDWVGGRTSIFSAVGLLPAALSGFDIDLFLHGAADMDEITRSQDQHKNPALLLAQMWFLLGEGHGKKDMVILPYKDRLVLMSKYLQQLVMESLGKEQDLDGKVVHQGINVFGNKGSTDQHAYVQQLREGIHNFFATFIEVLRDDGPGATTSSPLFVDTAITSGDYLNGFLQGTRNALFENNRESITITIDELSAHSLGALIALYERAVGFYASMVHINAYHQPGVEAGKKAAQSVIALQSQIVELYQSGEPGVNLTAGEISARLSAVGQEETVFHILRHLAANPWNQITEIPGSSPKDVRFKRTL